MRFFTKLSGIMLSLLAVVSLVAAQDDCPVQVEDALFALNDICLSIGRNEACYGNGDIVAVAQQNAVLNFDLPGDVALVDDIATISLSPYETSLDDWGIAILVVQADLPDTLPGQNVTMLLFGDVNLNNDSGAYYFTSGIGQVACNEAPNGLLIQTPDGVGQVNLTLNGINISLGSTAYLTTLDDDSLIFALLEGTSSLSVADSDEILLETAEYIIASLDEDGIATGDFTEPASIDDLDLPILPSYLLPEPLESEDSDSDTVSGDMIIPLDGAWQFTTGDIVFGSACPSVFIEQFNTMGLTQFGLQDGATQNIEFDPDDILGALFLDQAGDAFASSGASVSIDTSETNIYRILVNFEGIFVINYTWTVVSETEIQVEVFQDISASGIDCTIDVPIEILYQG